MKLSRMVDGLQRSTKVTVVICACVLALTAAVLLVLMFFPIHPTERTVIVAPANTDVVQTELELPQTTAQADENEVELPHTLSTWSANINGFYRDVEEFKTTKETTKDPFETTTTHKTTTTTTTSNTGTDSTGDTDDTFDTGETRDTTYTTTVDQGMTAPPMPTDATEPVVTPTDPPLVPPDLPAENYEE